MIYLGSVPSIPFKTMLKQNMLLLIYPVETVKIPCEERKGILACHLFYSSFAVQWQNVWIVAC